MKVIEITAPALIAVLSLGFQPLQAQSADEKIQQLEQKVDELDQRLKVAERQKEIKAEEDADKAKSTASVTANGGPFTIRSGDGNFVLRIGADFQVDNRTFPGESRVPLTDQILIRRARPTISGTVYKYVDFYIRARFRPGTRRSSTKPTRSSIISRASIFASASSNRRCGLERLQSDDDTSFIERGLPTLLVPSRDIGYQLSGDIVKNRVNYAVGVFNGVPDNSLSDASVSDHRDYAARIFLTPFLPEAKSPLSGLGVGIGASQRQCGRARAARLQDFRTEYFLHLRFRRHLRRPPNPPGAASLLLSRTLRSLHRIHALRRRFPERHRPARHRVPLLAGAGILHPHRRKESVRHPGSHAKLSIRKTTAGERSNWRCASAISAWSREFTTTASPPPPPRRGARTNGWAAATGISIACCASRSTTAIPISEAARRRRPAGTGRPSASSSIASKSISKEQLL